MNAANDRRIDYIEFPATDIEKTKLFYATVFGWKFEDYGPEYTSFHDGRLAGGFRKEKKVKADEHDEHGFGGGGVFADPERGDDGDAEREVGGDLLFKEGGDGVIEGLVAGEDGDEDGGIEPEEGLEDARQIQGQQYAEKAAKP